MFVIVNNNSVHLGPMPWRKLFFENCLEDDLEITVTLPQTNNPETAFVVNETTTILPVEMSPNPDYNPKIQGLNGPFWNFTAEKAIGNYVVIDLPIDLVKGQLKEQIAANRYNKEIGGTATTLQSTAISLDTSRDGRNIFLQAMQLGATNIGWKFPECWLTVTNTELQQCVEAIMAHVQTCFSWESTKCSEIDACTTLAELDAVVTEYVV